MREIRPPQYGFFDGNRGWERRAVFRRELQRLIDGAVRAGWREDEIALEVADLADEYVMKLARRKTAQAPFLCANDNG
ncbi:hypothetical protein ASC90_08975 [Rhizobium sp. Root1220]|nr:hypothetical protein ASC90_08975 [Rhizobium sp. Root1220]